MAVVIELDRVSKRYGDTGAPALRECSLIVEDGDFVTVVGPSGSGKSTLLNIVGLLDKPTSGRYALRGQETSVLREDQRARTRGKLVGFVFQSFQLLQERTCLDNVMLADVYTGKGVNDSRAAAAAALSSVGLGSRLGDLPSELSGGERQRVAIARAIMGDPAILLCDEPTGNLDSRNAEAILDLVRELNRHGTTVMLVTHDAAVAKLGDRQISTFDGTVTELARDED